jgi:GTP-binding protein Era
MTETPQGQGSPARAGKPHRSGVVALLGRPNAGKSTLMNRLLGEKLAIVGARPQTTRSRILGILTRPDAQLLLLDTPGLHAGGGALNRALQRQAAEAAADCDVALLLVDPREGFGEDQAALLGAVIGRGTPAVVAATKLDLAEARRAAWPPPGTEAACARPRISARTGEGLPALLDALVEQLPEAPPLYPEDQLSDRPLRFLVAELVRESASEALAQELPYALAVEVVAFEEDRDITRIRANLLVERASQKRIVVGSGGAVIKQIGVRARREIERLLGARVHLELWVKPEPRWARSPKRLKSLGYS